MKKYIAAALMLFVASAALPERVSAAGDLLRPTSPLYFLQSWGESVQLFFSFSKESKLNYLSHLNDKRILELQTYAGSDAQLAGELANQYESNYQKIEVLANEASDESQTADKVESKNLTEQDALAKVYNQVPEEAKPAILNAQMNSSKNVSAVLKKVSPDKVEEYTQKVEEIQKAQMIGKAAKVEKESGNEGGNPEGRGPKTLNSIKGGNELNQINTTNSTGSQGSQGRIQQAPMAAPAGQN